MEKEGPMKHFSTVRLLLFLIPILMVLQGCMSTVNPGSRGLRWYPFTTGLMKDPLKEGIFWRAPWNDVFVYDT